MRPPAEAQLLDFLFIIIIIMWSNFRGVSLQRSGSVIVGTQSYTLRLSSQNTLSLSRAGSFHGFALGLCNCKRGRYLESQKWQHLQDMQRKSDTVVMHVWFTGYQLLTEWERTVTRMQCASLGSPVSSAPTRSARRSISLTRTTLMSLSKQKAWMRVKWIWRAMSHSYSSSVARMQNATLSGSL